MVQFGTLLFGWLLIFGDMMAAAFLHHPLASRSFVSRTSSLILRAVSKIATAPQVSKKKKNLLHKEILRDSTIVISPAAHSTEVKERLRRQKVSYPLLRRSLLHYKMRYGDMLVPTIFMVPGESCDWPEEMWGLHLGKIVQSLRRGRRSDMKEDLISIGFHYSVSSMNFEIVKEILLTYKELNGNLYVPRKYIVPNSSDWEESCWGTKLGDLVSNLRKSISPDSTKYSRLLDIGFTFDVCQSRFETLARALSYYKELSGDEKYSIPKGFVVPRTEDWPKEFWDLRLGLAMTYIKRGRYRKFENDLLKIGITIPSMKK